jgi:general secretion pathway protein G
MRVAGTARQSSFGRGRARASGFTLIEVLIVVSVLAILAAAVTPMVMQQLLDARIQSAREQVRAVHEAIWGRDDPQRQSFGFVGDIGHLPSMLLELAQPGTIPLYHTDTVRNVGMGWNGPYVRFGNSPLEFVNDPWGRPLVGAEVGQIRSAGPDGQYNTDDDIYFPPRAGTYFGRLMVTLKRYGPVEGVMVTTIDPPNYEVRLYYSMNGKEQVVIDREKPFVFDYVPMGLHAIQVVHTSDQELRTEETVAVPGNGGTKLVEFFWTT